MRRGGAGMRGGARRAMSVGAAAMLVAMMYAPRAAAQRATAARAPLRVCADPNNLPFSDRHANGFENRIADVLAHDFGTTVQYTWFAERRGFLRNTLKAHRCDLAIGVPVGDEQVLTTAPIYRSTYVFAYRRDRGYHLRSLDDPRLRTLSIGIHLIGADLSSLPPGVALARRRIITNVHGYSIYGNYATVSPPSDLVRAVARGAVDVAIVWGPIAGYWARHVGAPLEVVPVSPTMASTHIPFAYAMAIGVRRGDSALRARLDGALRRHRAEIDRILRAYGVPLVADPASDTRLSCTTARRTEDSCD